MTHLPFHCPGNKECKEKWNNAKWKWNVLFYWRFNQVNTRLCQICPFLKDFLKEVHFYLTVMGIEHTWFCPQWIIFGILYKVIVWDPESSRLCHLFEQGSPHAQGGIIEQGIFIHPKLKCVLFIYYISSDFLLIIGNGCTIV